MSGQQSKGLSEQQIRLSRSRVQLRNEEAGLRRLAKQAAFQWDKNGRVSAVTASELDTIRAQIESTKAVIAELEAGEAL